MKRMRRKTFKKIEDLATHDEVNLAVEQLAPYWNVELQTVRKWIRDAPEAQRRGEAALHGFRIGRSLRVRRDVALAFERRGHLKRGAA